VHNNYSEQLSIHKTDGAIAKAEELGIRVNIPTHGPHHNPIEQIWQALKRRISLLFKLTTEELKSTINILFIEK